MTTFDELVEETLSYLRGYVRLQEQSTWLSASLTSSATTMTVANGARLGMGRAEVEDELVWVDSVSGSTATLAPWGRGLDGSTAAAHNANARVTFSPLFPRSVVRTQLNNTIEAVGKEIQVPQSYTFSYVAPRTTYSLPADTNAVFDVSWESVGPSLRWIPVKRWSLNQRANTTAFPTGKSVDILDAITPGRTVQLSYFKLPSRLSSGSDTLESTAGLPSSCRDVVVLGAAYRMVSGLDVAMLDPTSVSAGFFDERRLPGTGSQVARTIFALFQQRLSEETDRFRDQYPTPVHFRR
jgi:hypothetical protein